MHLVEDEDPLSLDAACSTSVELPTISLPNKGWTHLQQQFTLEMHLVENEDPLSSVAACSASVELPATNKGWTHTSNSSLLLKYTL